VPTIGKKSYIRMDREEIVEIHDMSLEEKQETLQFPLTTTPSEKEEKPPKAPPELEVETPINVQTSELTFRDIEGIAANLARLPEEHRADAIKDMQGRIATTLRVQRGCIGPDGVVETFDDQIKADAFAEAWLKLAVEKALAPPPTADVTRLCPYPGCIDFADHEGDHRFPKPAPEQMADSAVPEPQRQPEKKTRKRKPHAPPPEPPCQEPPPVGGPQ
jgi:hypothetical protein